MAHRVFVSVIGLRQATDDLIHLVANFLVAIQCHHVAEPAALGHVKQGILLTGVFVGDVFDEEENEDVILSTARRPCPRAARRNFSRVSCKVRIS